MDHCWFYGRLTYLWQSSIRMLYEDKGIELEVEIGLV